MNALLLASPRIETQVYPPDIQADIKKLAGNLTVLDPSKLASAPAELEKADVIFGTWGMPKMDEAFMAKAPNLKAVFYGAGSIKNFTTDAFWSRHIPVCSAYGANAVPVAEFTFAQIILSLKNAWRFMASTRANRAFPKDRECIGTYRSTVGLVSLGMIGKMVRQRLRSIDVKVIAYDPFVSPQQAAELDVELCSIEELFKKADLVSLHTPWLKETENMIRGGHFASMKPGASFINTSRGAVVHEKEMAEAAAARPDLTILLDVTYPEPPPPDSPLYSLPNVHLTPHIAGSVGGECARMGRYMADEFERFLKGEKLRWSISREMSLRLA